MGGAVKAIEQKFYQNEITKSAYDYQRAIETKKKIIVGVNEFVGEMQSDVEILRVDDSVQRRQIERLEQLRARRNTAALRSSLGELRAAASTDENLLPHILKSVEAYASIGEISDVLREVWGEYKE
jgi:methylmalonyl-CoA mutase, N-terminal domain